MSDAVLRDIIARRTREIEVIVQERGDAAHFAAKSRADKIHDDVLADFIRRESAPEYILEKVASIRRMAAFGELEIAYKSLEYLQTRLDYITQVVRAPVLQTGIKQRQSLAEQRNHANELRQREARQRHAVWQVEAADIWGRHPSWSASAVAKLVKKNLGAPEGCDTIRRAIRKPE